MKSSIKKYTERVNSCPLCKSSLKFLYTGVDRMLGMPGMFGINRCISCSLFVLSPRPTQKQIGLYYPSNKYYAYTKGSGGFFHTLRSYLVRHYYEPTILSKIISTFVANVPALPYARPPGRILDVGCGTGETLVMLKKLGWDVYGMDIDKKAIQIANKRGVTNVMTGGYKDLKKYPNDFFDAIRLYHVIEHLDDPIACILLLYKKLKRNGELIIGTPNAKSIVSTIFKSNWYNLDSPRHLVIFTPQNLKRYIESYAFQVTTISFASAGGIAGSLMYWLNDRVGIKTDLIHNVFVILILYPLEWVMDRLKVGDIFVLRAIKR